MSNAEKARVEAEKCLKLMEERDAKYGDSWKDARLLSLVDYVLMKYNRMNRLAENPVGNADKLESDLQDCINYAFFCLIKLKEIKQNAVEDLSFLSSGSTSFPKGGLH